MSYFGGEYDVAVIGAGHAGCEAALSAARLGMKTLVFSISLEAVANMPCNPHIGGSSKGHLVREIDCLGGEMGKNIDKTMIQIKMLNTSKGPAVHSLRAQADRKRYQAEMKHTLEKQKNLELKQAEITKINLKDGKVESSNLTTTSGRDGGEVDYLAEDITVGNDTAVNVYVYYDGDTASIYTNNLSNLNTESSSVTVTFTADALNH